MATGPSSPAAVATGTVTAPSPRPAAQAGRRWPARHSLRHPSASGSPHGATGARDDTSINARASHVPGAPSGAKRTAAIAIIPAGSQSSASAQNPHRPVDTVRTVLPAPR